MSARTVTWTPPPGVLLDLPETATDVAAQISVEVEEQAPAGGAPGTPPPAPIPIAVDHYSAEITPAQNIIDVAAGAHRVSVAAASLAGLFPIEHIDYRAGGRIHRIHAWDQLPADARIVAFKPSAQQAATFALAVTAHLADDSRESAAWSLIVNQDWSAAKTRLQEAIHARRH